MSNFQDDWGGEAPQPSPEIDNKIKLYTAPNGTVWADEGIFLADGQWLSYKKRPATEKEIGIFNELQMKKAQTTPAATQPQPAAAAPEPVKSGSHNDHARLAPSGWKTWSTCTRQPSYLEENKERVFKIYVGRVNKLAPYLMTFPNELGEHEVRAMRIAADLRDGKRTYDSLTEQDREDIKKTESSQDAREGTRAHDFAAAILAGRKTLEDIPSEFREPVGEYVALCGSLAPEGSLKFIEAKLPLFYQPRSNCTCDFASVTFDGNGNVESVNGVDLKYGAGVKVAAKDNLQLVSYGVSLLRHVELLYELQPDIKVTMRICQPRHHDKDDAVWETTIADLESHAAFLVERSNFIEKGEGLTFAPSKDACMFCDCKGFCEAAQADVFEPMQDYVSDPMAFLSALPDFDDDDAALPPLERAEAAHTKAGLNIPVDNHFALALFKNWKRLQDYYPWAVEYLTDMAHSGCPEPGTKLVLGRAGDRAWTDEDAADKFLTGQKLKKDERYKMVLKSPAQIEKLLKLKFKASPRSKTRFEELVTRGDAKPVLALEDDKREAVSAGVDLLGDLPEEEPVFDLS